MKKLKLTQAEIDKLVVVERRVVPPTVFGVGRNDVGFQTKSASAYIWQYQLWQNMLKRCFSGSEKIIKPAYKNVTCCDEWLSFANFFEWVNKELDYTGKPYLLSLDKDLIIKGNKIYSPATCSFVPEAINNLLTSRAENKGRLPIGVSLDYSKFKAQLAVDGKNRNLGRFDTPEEAFQVYKVAKEAQIKAVANQYKDVLKPAVYESLMNWEIEP